MMRMHIQPNVAAFEAYANAQIQIVETRVQECAAVAGSTHGLPQTAFLSEVSTQIGLIVDGFNQSRISGSNVDKLLPQLKNLRDALDKYLNEIKAPKNWIFRFMHPKVVARYESAADRVDSLVESFEISQNQRFYDFVREVAKETVA